MLHSQVGIAPINGAQLPYEQAGSGFPLLLLHGHLLDNHQWDDQFAAFAEYYQVIRYDARGYGRSVAPPGPCQHHDDLRALLDLLGIERAALVGCSGGGEIVIDFALAHPARTAALVTVGGALSGYPFPAGPPDPLAVEANAAYELGDIDLAVELTHRRWTDGPNRTATQVNQAARAHMLTMTRQLYQRPDDGVEEQTLEPPAYGRLGAISAPLLAIVGSEEPGPFHAIADLYATQVPGARKLVIADAGHHPNMEHPAVFNQAVLDFLADALG